MAAELEKEIDNFSGTGLKCKIYHYGEKIIVTTLYNVREVGPHTTVGIDKLVRRMVAELSPKYELETPSDGYELWGELAVKLPKVNFFSGLMGGQERNNKRVFNEVLHILEVLGKNKDFVDEVNQALVDEKARIDRVREERESEGGIPKAKNLLLKKAIDDTGKGREDAASVAVLTVVVGLWAKVNGKDLPEQYDEFARQVSQRFAPQLLEAVRLVKEGNRPESRGDSDTVIKHLDGQISAGIRGDFIIPAWEAAFPGREIPGLDPTSPPAAEDKPLVDYLEKLPSELHRLMMVVMYAADNRREEGRD